MPARSAAAVTPPAPIVAPVVVPVATIASSLLATVLKAYPNVIHVPYDWSNDHLLLTPSTWLFVCSECAVTRDDVKGKFGQSGIFIESFRDHLTRIYGNEAYPTTLIKRLVDRVTTTALLFVRVTTLADLLDETGPIIEDAKEIIRSLDGDRINRTYGAAAAKTFKISCELDGRRYSLDTTDALKETKKTLIFTKRKPNSSSTCRRCQQPFSGPYSDHAKHCKVPNNRSDRPVKRERDYEKPQDKKHD